LTHSLGPWRVEGVGNIDGSGVSHYHIRPADDWRPVATVWRNVVDGRVREDVLNANAQLVAKAPELKDALTRQIANMRQLIECEGLAVAPETLDACKSDLEEAIRIIER